MDTDLNIQLWTPSLNQYESNIKPQSPIKPWSMDIKVDGLEYEGWPKGRPTRLGPTDRRGCNGSLKYFHYTERFKNAHEKTQNRKSFIFVETEMTNRTIRHGFGRGSLAD